MGAVAEFERSMLKERQLEGIALAKKAGVYKGRKPSLTPERHPAKGACSSRGKKAALAREFGISCGTLYAYSPAQHRDDSGRMEGSGHAATGNLP